MSAQVRRITVEGDVHWRLIGQNKMKQERAGYILMQRIKPQPYEAYVLRRGEVSLIQAICELGIFSVYVRYLPVWSDSCSFFSLHHQ